MSVTNRNFNPSGNIVVDGIKRMGAELGEFITDNVPDGRRKAVALTELETALMWAVKAAVVGDEE